MLVWRSKLQSIFELCLALECLSCVQFLWRTKRTCPLPVLHARRVSRPRRIREVSVAGDLNKAEWPSCSKHVPVGEVRTHACGDVAPDVSNEPGSFGPWRDEGTMFLRNVGREGLSDTASYPRKRESLTDLIWLPELKQLKCVRNRGPEVRVFSWCRGIGCPISVFERSVVVMIKCRLNCN
jgi:hypothetical protein